MGPTRMKPARHVSGWMGLALGFALPLALALGWSALTVWLEAAETIPRGQIMSGPRIGIEYAEEWKDKPWRFWIRDNPWVSC